MPQNEFTQNELDILMGFCKDTLTDAQCNLTIMKMLGEQGIDYGEEIAEQQKVEAAMYTLMNKIAMLETKS